jgi:hypothetical protein
VKAKRVEVEEHEKDRLEPNYSLEFMAGLMQNPDLVRNVAVIGHLHHGKTLLMDMLVEQTHDVQHEYRSNAKELRYTDTRLDEQVHPHTTHAWTNRCTHTPALLHGHTPGRTGAPTHPPSYTDTRLDEQVHPHTRPPFGHRLRLPAVESAPYLQSLVD